MKKEHSLVRFLGREKEVIDKIAAGIKDFTDVAVLGMSGGADSTLVALLCRKALGTKNVFSLHMPYGDIDLNVFNSRSLKTAAHLGINAKIVSIKDSVDTVIKAGEHVLERPLDTLNAGNTRSRARMMLLYLTSHGLSSATGNRVRVIGTGNLSEDFIGYDTKGGDALADIFPIGELFKSEVYHLLDYFKEQGEITDEMIDRKPSAGLWDGQSDEEEIGYSYNEMQPAIESLLSGKSPATELELFVFNRHKVNKHKHEAPPTVVLGLKRK